MRNLARRGELRVAEVRPVHVDRPHELGHEQLRAVHAVADQLRTDGSLRRRSPTTGRPQLQPSPYIRTQPAGLLPRLQRRRVRADQALLRSLGGERQLRVEQGRSTSTIRSPASKIRPTSRTSTARRSRRNRPAPASTTCSPTRSGCSRLRGQYTLPWEIGLAGSASVTQGYPLPAADRGYHRAATGSPTPTSTSTRSATCACRTCSSRTSASTRRSASAACASSRAWISST